MAVSSDNLSGMSQPDTTPKLTKLAQLEKLSAQTKEAAKRWLTDAELDSLCKVARQRSRK